MEVYEKNSLIALIVFSMFFFSTCKTPDNQNIVETGDKQPMQESMPIKDFDPYFINSNKIESKLGPRSISRNIIEDQDGKFWFATWEGIIAYDGNVFTNYTNKDSLRKYHTFAVQETSQGDIWFGSIGGGVYYYKKNMKDPARSTFHNFTTTEGLISDMIGCFLEDSQGRLWIGTMNGINYIEKEDLDAQSPILHTLQHPAGENNGDINSIIEDAQGNLWFGTRGETYYFNPTKQGLEETVKFNKFLLEDGRQFTNVRSIIEDKNNHIWLGGNDGLWKYDGEQYMQYSTNFTGFILQSKKGEIWSCCADPNPHQWLLQLYDHNSIVSPVMAPVQTVKVQEGQIFGIFEDSESNIWYGQEKGICRLNPTELENLDIDCF